MAMCDLHLHLDGSLSPEWVLREAERQQYPLPGRAASVPSILPFLQVNAQSCGSLNDYLTKFDLPCQLLQTEAAIESAVYDLLKRLSAQNIALAEIRFAPQLHTSKLRQEEVVLAALSGLSAARRDFPIRCALIGCCMRMADNHGANMETIRLCHKYQTQGMAAADLAGAEALYATDLFEDVFQYAGRLNVPFTIHAGEAAGAESIRKALDFGAARIGHGIRCTEDEALVSYLCNHNIPLEMCPTSNVQTHAIEAIEQHPILALLDRGLCVTVNTDNMTVSNTTLAQEYALLENRLGMTAAQKAQLEKNAERACFL